ncbi:MAG: hypothetical protein ACT4PP_00630 [Sporichthyaceae bacterium]
MSEMNSAIPPGRGNGLSAARYTPLVDLEPHFADALLEALAADGVAAYASPSPGVRGPYMDIVLPNRPTDRVWVDTESEAGAKALLAERRAEFSADSETEIETAWRAIVAGYDTNGHNPVPTWPVSEDLDEDPPARRRSIALPFGGEPGPRRTDEEDERWGAEPAAETAEAGEPQEHYVPPPPPPLPRISPHAKLAWAGVVGGPTYLMVSTWTGASLFYGASAFAVTAFIGGFAALVYRMKDDRGPGGDGAVV